MLHLAAGAVPGAGVGLHVEVEGHPLSPPLVGGVGHQHEHRAPTQVARKGSKVQQMLGFSENFHGCRELFNKCFFHASTL